MFRGRREIVFPEEKQAGPPLEFLLVYDPGTFPDHHQLIGRNIRNHLGIAITPANAQVGYGLTAQAKVQAAVIDGIETALRGDLLRLLPLAISRCHSRADGAAITVGSNQQNFQPVASS